MKTTKLCLLFPLTVSLSVAASVAMASNDEPSDDLDVTMTVMEDGQSPSGFVQQIELPPPETQIEGGAAMDVISEVTTESGAIADEVAEIVTGSINDRITIEDIEGLPDLPDDIVDNLDDDATILDDILGSSPNTDSVADNTISGDVSGSGTDMTTESDPSMTDVTDSTDQVTRDSTDIMDSTDDMTQDLIEETENDDLREDLDRLRRLP